MELYVLNKNNYQGYGWEYNHRNEPHITIFDGKNPPNEEVVFEGTHEQLIELIKKSKHENNEKNN